MLVYTLCIAATASLLLPTANTDVVLVAVSTGAQLIWLAANDAPFRSLHSLNHTAHSNEHVTSGVMRAYFTAACISMRTACSLQTKLSFARQAKQTRAFFRHPVILHVSMIPRELAPLFIVSVHNSPFSSSHPSVNGDRGLRNKRRMSRSKGALGGLASLREVFLSHDFAYGVGIVRE